MYIKEPCDLNDLITDIMISQFFYLTFSGFTTHDDIYGFPL
ncbi:14336_t:CDS:2 [Rhizophagus irregularis]|nr:14336_t:CDS:2 [Rhizophagus irregularis]